MEKRDEFAYGDILESVRPVSAKRRPMPRIDRAAQFAPFAALNGYEDAVEECARRCAEEAEK